MPSPVICTTLYNLIRPNPLLRPLDDLPSGFGGLLPAFGQQQKTEETLVEYLRSEIWVRGAEMSCEEG